MDPIKLAFSGLLLFITYFASAQPVTPPQAAIRYFELADSSYQARRFAEAYPYIQLADSIQQLVDPASEMAAKTYYLYGILAYNLGDYPTAIQKLTQGAQLYQLFDQPGFLADCFVMLGNAVWYQEGAEPALSFFDRAIAAAQADKAEQRKYRGKYYADKGYALLDLGNMIEGKSLIDQGLSLDLRYFGPLHLRTAETYLTLHTYYIYLEDYFQALATLHKVEQIYLQSSQIDLAVVYGNMAKIHGHLGQYPEAQGYYSKALATFKQALPPNHPNIILCYTQIAESYHNAGNYEQSRHYYQLASQANTEGYPVFDIIIKQGLVFDLQHQGKHQQVKPILRELLGLVDAQYGPSRNLALIYEQIGENHQFNQQPDSARAAYHQALALYWATQGVNTPADGRIYQRLSTTFLPNIQLDSASYYLEKGLDIYWYPHRDFAQIPQPQTWLLLMDTKAKVYEARGADNDLRAALATLQLIDEYLDHLRQQADRPEMKQLLAPETDNTHGNIIRLLYQQREKWPDAAELAFFYAEKNKSILLLEAILESGITQLDQLNRQLAALRTEINFYERKLYDQANRTDQALGEDVLTRWRATIFDNQKAIAQLVANAQTEFPELLRHTASPDLYRLDSLRQYVLTPDRILLEYQLTPQHLFIFVVTNDTLIVEALPLNFPLADWVQRFRSSICSPYLDSRLNDSSRDQLLLQYIQYAQQLYQVLIAPVQQWLQAKEVIVAPDDYLALLPLDALLSAHPTDLNNFATYPFLLHKFQLSQTHSGTLLRIMSQPNATAKHTAQRMLAFAPFYSNETIATQHDNHKQPVVNLADNIPTPHDPLPFSGEEVRVAATYFDGVIVTGVEATPEFFLTQTPRAQMVHVATHAKSNPQKGELAYLIMAPGASGEERVYVGDLYNLNLQTDLVVLSACETGLGELRAGEGIIGLTHAFAHAGARSIVSSLWQVNDRSTSAIMAHFYQNLADQHIPKCKAIHLAKQQYLSQAVTNGSKHPYFWSSFVFVGDTGLISHP